MAKREFVGSPVNGTNGHDGDPTPPWANDGETIDATDPDGEGDVKTEQFSLDSIDLSEGEDSDITLNGEEWIPTEEQVADARRVLLSGEVSAKELAELYNISRRTVSKYVRGEAKVNPEDPPPIKGDEAGVYTTQESDGAENPGRKEIANMRERALSGESTPSIAEDIGRSEDYVRARLRGDVGPDVASPPELSWEGRAAGWQPADEGSGDSASQPDKGDKTDGDSLSDDEWIPTEEQVAEVREVLLNGELSLSEIGSKYGVNKQDISPYVRGEEDVDPDNPPAIEGDINGEYTVREDANREPTGQTAKDKLDAKPNERSPVNASERKEDQTSLASAVIAFCAGIALGWLFGGEH